MTKSIEALWETGFISDKDLTAPKVNDLYNRKAQNMLDKFSQLFVNNIIVLACSIIALPILGYFWEMFYFFIYLSLLSTPLIIQGYIEIKNLKKIDKTQTSYDYLKQFDLWFKQLMSTYGRIYSVLYPLLSLGMIAFLLQQEPIKNKLSNLVERFPTEVLIFSLPYYLVIALGLLVIFVALISKLIYRLDMNIVYGRKMAKLSEILSDMESLRANH